MDELVIEKLKAMGYKDVPKELAAMLAEYKRRQDCVRPAQLSLDAIVSCTMMYEMFKASRASKEQGGKEQGSGGEKKDGEWPWTSSAAARRRSKRAT